MPTCPSSRTRSRAKTPAAIRSISPASARRRSISTSPRLRRSRSLPGRRGRSAISSCCRCPTARGWKMSSARRAAISSSAISATTSCPGPSTCPRRPRRRWPTRCRANGSMSISTRSPIRRSRTPSSIPPTCFATSTFTRAEERAAVIAFINAKYRGTDPANLQFDVLATAASTDIPAAVRNAGQFVTVFVNRLPDNQQPGGQASEIDLGNRNLGGIAAVQINGILGGPLQPAATSDNFVKLTGKIATHEVAHLLGLRTLPMPSAPSALADTSRSARPSAIRWRSARQRRLKRTTTSSVRPPASAATDSTTCRDLYFGEREAIKLSLAFADRSQTTIDEVGTDQCQPRRSRSSLATISVPNSLRPAIVQQHQAVLRRREDRRWQHRPRSRDTTAAGPTSIRLACSGANC